VARTTTDADTDTAITMTSIRLCGIDEVPDGKPQRFDTTPPVAVFRVGDEFFATADSCSHEEWSLGEEGELEGYEVLCTLHMARFDVRDGRPLCLPALNPVQTYPVTVVGDELFVDLG
jgi:nitrite reductase/ring-hydroxylating ferredoxin subunit